MWDKRVVRGNTYASMIAKKQLAESSQTKGKSGIVKHQKANIKAVPKFFINLISSSL